VASRSYKSELRQEQAEATRTRILDALVEVMAEGVDSLSIPAVAQQAGVSVGTVYRHFGDKPGLLRALIDHAAERTRMIIETVPRTLDGLDETVRSVFRHFENTDDLLRAAFASRLGREARIESSGERLETIERMITDLRPGLRPAEARHLSNVALILTASDTYREWRERLGLTPDEAADEVMWTIATLLKGIECET
jgi:AcrR family transcriptional regulator